MSSLPLSRRTSCPSKADDVHPSLPFLLQLDEHDVYSLPKSDLRAYFFALQAHARARSLAEEDSIVSMQWLPSPMTDSVKVAEMTSLRQTPRLLLLPPEVRRLIYTYLLSPMGTMRRGPHPRQLQAPLYFAHGFSPAILQTNRQIHDEAVAVFYGNKTQRVHVTIDYNIWNHKQQRSDFLLSSKVTASIRQVHINIHLGNEKRARRLEKVDSDVRFAVVKKGARKLGKWLGGNEIRSLNIGWQEPPKTFTWEQKREILDEFRVLRPESCEITDLNWGLAYPGKKYQFHVDYLKDLQRDNSLTEPPISRRPS